MARSTVKSAQAGKTGTRLLAFGRNAGKPNRPRGLFSFKHFLRWSCILALWSAIGLTAVVAYESAYLPPLDQITIPKRPPVITILDVHGEQIAVRGDTAGELGGAAIHLADMPDYVPKAFIAIEDRRFYQHWGLDPYGMVRALVRDVFHRKGMEGGSTLTQQLAKNLFLTKERSLSRKIQEAILALWLERHFSKDQILELYLNRVYFGAGAYGLDAAAHRYFSIPARNLTLAEAAMLAGLMKAPARLAPSHNLKAATERAKDVVAAMVRETFISAAQAKQLEAAPARVIPSEAASSVNYAADYVADSLSELIGAIDEDVIVTTTLDKRIQFAGEDAMNRALLQKGSAYGVGEGALIALAPDGAVVAMVGGRNYQTSQFNRATSAYRQPGSAFKPFVYLAALEHGDTPDTVREDGPISVHGWAPENYARTYFGPVTLTKALSLSLNTVAVRLGLEVGAKTVARTAERLGIVSPLRADATLALGTSEVSPLELTSAYVPFANGGRRIAPYVISKVKTARDKLLFSFAPALGPQVVALDILAMQNTMMEETLITGTAHHAELPQWQAGGKTGTSSDFRDAWFVGYTSRLIAGVWLGNDDGAPTKKASGGNLPVDIWSAFMRAALQGVAPEPLPFSHWTRPSPVASFFGMNFGARAQGVRPSPAQDDSWR